MGAFDQLKWTYNGAFEQLFGLRKGEFEQNFPKIQMPGGVARGGCLSFDLTGTLRAWLARGQNVEKLLIRKRLLHRLQS